MPPPFEVQQRAWECAYVLHAKPLEQTQRGHVNRIYNRHPDNMTWLDVCRMFLLYRDVLG